MADEDIVASITLEGADTVSSQLSGIGDKGVAAFQKIGDAAKKFSDIANESIEKVNASGRFERGLLTQAGGGPLGLFSSSSRSPLGGNIGALAGAEAGAVTGVGVEAGEVAGRSIFGGSRRIPISLVAREALRLAGINFPGAGLATHIGVEAAEAGGTLAPTLAIGGVIAGLTALNVALERTADAANDAKQRLGDLFGSREQGAAAFERVRLAAPGLGLTSGQLAAPAEAAAGLARSFTPAYPGQPAPPQFNQASILSAVESLIAGLKADRVSSSDASKATTDLFTRLQKGFLSEEDLKALEQVSPETADRLAKAILSHPAAGPGGVFPFSTAQGLPAGLTPIQQLREVIKEKPEAITGASVVQAATSLGPENAAALKTAKDTESLGTAFSSLGASLNAVFGAISPFASFAAAIQAAADAVGRFAAFLNRVTASEPKTPAETPPRVAGTEDARARFRRAQYGLEEPAAGAPATRPAPEVTTPETAPGAISPAAPRRVLVGPPGAQREFQVPAEGGAPLTPPGAATIFRGGAPTTYAVPREGQVAPLSPEQGGPLPGTVTVGPPGAPRQFTVPHETEPIGGRPGGELVPGLSLLSLIGGLFSGGGAASPAAGAGLDQVGANAPEAATGLQQIASSAPQAGAALGSLAGVIQGVAAAIAGAIASLTTAPPPPVTPDTLGARGATGGLFTGLNFSRYAYGGPVGGVGSGKSDSNLALLSRGEYVHQEPAVAHYGLSMMHAINNMTFPKFSLGGLMDGISSSMNFGVPRLAAGGVASSAASPAGYYEVNLKTDYGNISGLRAGERQIDQLSRSAANRQIRTSFTGGGVPDWYGGRNS
jgi:hypothetical protein